MCVGKFNGTIKNYTPMDVYNLLQALDLNINVIAVSNDKFYQGFYDIHDEPWIGLNVFVDYGNMLNIRFTEIDPLDPEMNENFNEEWGESNIIMEKRFDVKEILSKCPVVELFISLTPIKEKVRCYAHELDGIKTFTFVCSFDKIYTNE